MIALLTASEMRSLEQEAIATWGIPSLVLQEHAALGALALLPAGAAAGGAGRARATTAATPWPWPGWPGSRAARCGSGPWSRARGGRATPRSRPGSGRAWAAGYSHCPRSARRPWPDSAAGWWTGCSAWAPGCRWRAWPRTGCRPWPTPRAPARRFRVLALDLPSGLDPSSPEAARAVRPGRPHRLLRPPEGLPRPAPRPGALRRDHGRPHPAAPRRRRPGPAAGAAGPALPGPLGHPQARLRPRGHPRRVAGHGRRRGAGRPGRPAHGGRAGHAAARPRGARRGGGPGARGHGAALGGPGARGHRRAAGGPRRHQRRARMGRAAGAGRLGPGPAAARPGWRARDTVITPHPGEFARLFPGPAPRGTAERLGRARAVADGPGILVLKGAQSIVAGGRRPGTVGEPHRAPGPLGRGRRGFPGRHGGRPGGPVAQAARARTRPIRSR